MTHVSNHPSTESSENKSRVLGKSIAAVSKFGKSKGAKYHCWKPTVLGGGIDDVMRIEFRGLV
jgi:hypothetical protein